MTQNKKFLNLKETALGHIPDTWDCLPLSSADISVIDGDRGREYPKQHDFGTNGYCLFLSAANVTKQKFAFDDCQFISEEKDSLLRKGKLIKRDIVITTRGTVGNIALFDENVPYDNIRINSGMAIIRSKETLIYSEFLQEMLISDIIQNQINRFSFGSAQPQLTISIINNLLLCIPSLKEQKSIVKVLSRWDRAIDLTEQLITVKQERRKWMMQKLLTARQRLPGFNKPWRTMTLGKAFSNRVETGYPDLPLVAITGENGVVPREGLVRRDTSSEDKSRYLMICPGDIGYNTMRMWQGVCGFSRLEGIVSPAYTVVTPKNGIDGEFMALLFKSQPVIHLFHRHSQGMVNDTLNLKYQNFARIRVTIPEKEEQQAITSTFRMVDREIALLKEQAAALEEQKKGLMQQLLTGKIRVKLEGKA